MIQDSVRMRSRTLAAKYAEYTIGNVLWRFCALGELGTPTVRSHRAFHTGPCNAKSQCSPSSTSAMKSPASHVRRLSDVSLLCAHEWPYQLCLLFFMGFVHNGFVHGCVEQTVAKSPTHTSPHHVPNDAPHKPVFGRAPSTRLSSPFTVRTSCTYKRGAPLHP